MDRLAALFEQLSLPAVSRVLRRTVFAGSGVGLVALGVAAFAGHLLVGVGACLGLALGLANVRLVTASVARVNSSAVAHPKRVLASQTLARLAITTAVVVGLLLASLQLGFGTAGGIALFYLVLIVNLLGALLRQAGAVGPGATGPGASGAGA